MTKLINFIDTIAWISCILSFLLVCLRVWVAASYSVFEQGLDRSRGVKRTSPIAVPGIILAISFAWLVS